MNLRNIAIIEDDDDIRGCFEDILREVGFSVVGYANGRLAMDALSASSPPDLILCDLMMPEMNGWEFLEAWSLTHNEGDSVPIIVVSAVADLRALGHKPVREVVRKPVDLASLVGLVMKYCNGPTVTMSSFTPGRSNLSF